MSTAELAAGPGPRAEHSRHAHRFRLAFFALVGLCICCLGLAVALSSGGRKVLVSSGWSSWSPQDAGLAGAQEIANYLAPDYRATPSAQLAVISVVNLNDPAKPIEVVVPSNGSSGSLVPLSAGNTVVYNLCGTGSGNCSIGAGQPSTARTLLLRREALELALYTFKYVAGSQQVVAILPPGHSVVGCTGICPKPHTPILSTTTTTLAVAFDRAELLPWLNRPLRATLPEPIPPTVAQMPNAPEAELVSVITAHGLFAERAEQAQDGSSVIVLSPSVPQ